MVEQLIASSAIVLSSNSDIRNHYRSNIFEINVFENIAAIYILWVSDQKFNKKISSDEKWSTTGLHSINSYYHILMILTLTIMLIILVKLMKLIIIIVKLIKIVLISVLKSIH